MRNSKDIFVVAQNQMANQIEGILKCAEYRCTTTTDVSKAVDLLENQYRLVILDLDLPKSLTRMLMSTIYAYYFKTRVLLITHNAGILPEMDFPRFYFQGFIIAPINPEELISRIKFQLFEYKSERILNYGNTTLNLGAARLSTDRCAVDISRYEQELSQILFENKNNLVTKDMILNRVSYLEFGGNLRSVDIRICKLRKKLRMIHSNLSIITKRNLGYYLIIDKQSHSERSHL